MSQIGSTLNNRYRLDKKIGEGGFAQVFLATDLELGRQVAVKVLEQNWTKDNELILRFRNEARAIAVLDHPNILQIYDFGIAGGAPYLVMPYVRGGTFADRMKEGPFTLDEIGFYLNQIGSALDYAHQHGIIHRDVKPTNLLMRPDGQLVLMDFGLAKLLDDVSLQAKTGALGTVAYIAPEQSQGMVSAASDIYMLGVILYQMLTGNLPYEGNTTRVLLGHVYAAPASLKDQPAMRSIHPAVVQALDQVLTKVLAKLPADRYPTCQALCAAYYQALKADPNRARYQSSSRHTPNETLLTDKQLLTPPAPTASTSRVEVEPAKLPPAPAPYLEPAQTAQAASTDMPPVPPAPPESSPQTLSPADPEATVIGLSPLHRNKIMLTPPRLLVTTEPDRGFQATFDLTGETLTLGRATDNNLCVPLSIISRYHAVLSRLNSATQEPAYKIVQLKSINSLRFNGQEILEKVLENGDTIEIGMRGFAEYIVKLTYKAAEYGFA